MSQSDASSNQAPQSSPSALPPPCAGGCGFYGSKDQKNCCSVCFKKMYPEEASKKQPSSSNTTSTKDTQNTDKSKDPNTESKEDSTADDKTDKEEPKPKRKVQKKKNRCWNCRKKVTLAGQFECKCGYVFCGRHRYPDAHSCDFDHKQQHKDQLAKDNKTVAPPKLVNKI
eukprot:89200_1